MTTFESLDCLWNNSPILRISSRIVFISDMHIGTHAFENNYYLVEAVDTYYREREYTIIRPGDIFDIWTTDWSDIKRMYPSLIQKMSGDIELWGNHDNYFRGIWPEGLRLKVGDDEIFTCHGHQGDWINDEAAALGELLVKYPLSYLEQLGIEEPDSINRHVKQRARLKEWANSRQITSVFGHIHWIEIDDYYHCGGDSKEDGKVECLEFDDTGFHTKVWEEQT